MFRVSDQVTVCHLSGLMSCDLRVDYGVHYPSVCPCVQGIFQSTFSIHVITVSGSVCLWNGLERQISVFRNRPSSKHFG